MSARMQYPLSQRRHTNIAVVRYQKNGVRLEIACYKNKVISYRAGTEDRLDEVLQVDRVFSNVGRGYVASKEDIAAVFGEEMTEEDAIKYMLEHGELQVAQQERTAEVDEISKDIAIIISQKCVNTKTQRPFPTVVIEQALRSIGAGVKLDQPVKKQALGFIHQLVESQVIPIARANMKLRCLTPSEDGVALLDAWCSQHGAQVLERKTAMTGDAEANGKHATTADKQQHSLLILLQPNLFRDLDNLVKQKLAPGSSMHMVDAAVMEVGEGDVNLVARAAAATGSTSGGGGDSLDMESTRPREGHKQGGGRYTKAESLATSTAHGDGSDNDADDGNTDGRRRGKKGNKGKAARGKKGGRHGDDDDSDVEEGGHIVSAGNDGEDSDNDGFSGKARGGKKGKKGGKASRAPPPAVAGSDALTAELMKLGLDPAKDLVDDSNSDDEARGAKGKKGKGKNKGKGKAQPQPKKGGNSGETGKNSKVNKAEDSEHDSSEDEELAGNRRQRKKQIQQQQQQQYNNNATDEDEFDYGDDEEEAEEGGKH